MKIFYKYIFLLALLPATISLHSIGMEEVIKEWLFRKRAKTGEKTRLELFFELLKGK